MTRQNDLGNQVRYPDFPSDSLIPPHIFNSYRSIILPQAFSIFCTIYQILYWDAHQIISYSHKPYFIMLHIYHHLPFYFPLSLFLPLVLNLISIFISLCPHLFSYSAPFCSSWSNVINCINIRKASLS